MMVGTQMKMMDKIRKDYMKSKTKAICDSAAKKEKECN